MTYYSAAEIREGLEKFEAGYKRAFNFMHEYCNKRHAIIQDHGEVFYSCSIRTERNGFDKKYRECCFEECPLLMREE